MRREETDRESEIQELLQKTQASLRILERDPREDGDPIVYQMICEELRRELPALQARMAWLESEAADRRQAPKVAA